MNRDRILSAASDVFAAGGLGASLAAVAERAGVGIGTIYRRFPGKEALVVALLEQKISAVSRAAERAAGLTSGWDAFTALIENLAELLIADRALEEFLLSKHADPALALLRPVTTDVINRARADGALRPDIAFNDVAPLLVMVIGAANFSAGADPDSWRRYLQVMLDGLRDRPGTGPLATAPLTDSELDRVSRASPPPTPLAHGGPCPVASPGLAGGSPAPKSAAAKSTPASPAAKSTAAESTAAKSTPASAAAKSTAARTAPKSAAAKGTRARPAPKQP